MKYFLLILCFSISVSLFSQDDNPEITRGAFFKISFAGTITTNDDINFSDEFNDNLLEFNALFYNATIGYQFDPSASIGLNFEYDRHSALNLNFLPIFLSYRYNIIKNDDNIFIRGGYGRLLNIAKGFETGTLYKAGLGYQIFDGNIRNSFLIGVDFSRKRFGFKQQEKLSSVSLFLEFQFF